MQTRLQEVRPAPRSVLPLLWSFAFLSYVLRTNIAVAQQFMARELALNNLQIGYLFSAFLIGYTIFQVPAGVLGDRFGPRTVLTLSALWWAVTTCLTGFVPGVVVKNSVAALIALLLLRFLHGAGESSTYPVTMIAVANWFDPSSYAFVTAVIFTGSTFGSAFAPPLVAHVMDALGWRATFYVTGLLPIVIAVLWWRAARGERQRTQPGTRPSGSNRWWNVLRQRNVFFLCLSYFLYCYAISIFVYWLFKYLVDVRRLSIVNSGWATSLPWIAASLAVPVVGYISARLSHRLGLLTARRLTATVCLVVAALLMSVSVAATTIIPALTGIAASVALLFSTESSYWSTAVDIAPQAAGASSGLMNLAGNLGGVTSTLLVPILVARFDWSRALMSGSGFAVLAAICWFLISQNNASDRARHREGWIYMGEAE